MTVFKYTGSVQTFPVPSNATIAFIKVFGAGYSDDSKGGEGGYSEGRLAVTGGDTLYVRCGGVGVNGAGGGGAGGFNGGGDSFGGFSGCGASDVRQGGTALTNRKIVAGGAGGNGQTGTSPGRTGGSGGGTTGEDSQFSDATGGSQSQGGLNSYGSRAVNDKGGDGLSDSLQVGGGGGGGYHGGGGGDGIKGGGGGSGYIGGVTSGVTTQGGWDAAGRVEITIVQTTPNAAGLSTPINSALIDLTQVLPFGWVFSSDTPGDTQSQFDLRYRLVGAGSWTTVSSSTADTFFNLAANTLTAGDYEWQARVYGTIGLVGPYSPSAFFTAVAPPAAPVMTAPTLDANVDNPTPVTFTSVTHTAIQLRRVANNAGAPNPAVVYATGPVVNTAGNAGSVTFDVNNRVEHIQARVLATLWSAWGSVRVTTAFAPTAEPEVFLAVVSDSEGREHAIDVTVINPTPSGGEVDLSYNEVWIDDVDAEPGWQRRKTQLEENGTWRYELPRSGIDYDTRIKVVAVGTNGGTAEGLPS